MYGNYTQGRSGSMGIMVITKICLNFVILAINGFVTV